MTTQPIPIRASSFGSIFDCPARWIAINLEGRRSPSGAPAVIGSAVHRGTAVYDTERVAGRAPSLSAALDAAHQHVVDPGYDVDWSDESPDDVSEIARSLCDRYARLESPRHQFVAVEASVDSLLLSDLNIVLTGTTDRVYQAESGELGIADIKTGKTVVGADGKVKSQGHAAQLGIYELVASAAIGKQLRAPAQIIGLQANKTPEKQRIGVGEVTDARVPLLGDEHRSGLLQTAARIVHGQVDAWGNPKSMMCHKRYCPNFDTCFWRR